MKRYTIKPRQSEEYYEAYGPDFLARTIHEPDPGPYDTGLIDKHGNPILAHCEMPQIGFVRKL